MQSLREQWRNDSGPVPETGDVVRGEATALIRIPRFGSSYVMPVLKGPRAMPSPRDSGTSATQRPRAPSGTTPSPPIGSPTVNRCTTCRAPPRRPDRGADPESDVHLRAETDPNDLVIPFTAGWVVQAFPENPDGGVAPDPDDGRRLITLTTCSELFHTDDRMVAFGRLTSVRRAAG